VPITDAQLVAGIEAKNGFPLDLAQRHAVTFGAGPLMIAAGPGTGKTEVLVARCLKFLCCNGIAPASIMLTTFTEKAATNLQDRLSEAFLFLAAMYPVLAAVDPSDLRIGTLHGLCNDILQEYRYTAYQNLRLLDEVTSSLLVHKSVIGNIQADQPALYAQFSYLFGNKPQNALSKWDWALALQQIFNRLIEDQINVTLLQQAGGPWSAVVHADGVYEQTLANTCACDFSRLLRYFRDFLDTAQGNLLLTGDSAGVRAPLTHVLVDEYQDTNPIQESIYLRLADTPPHNITIVGDDDQALYRFRGGTVECMVGFPAACHARWGADPTIIYLSDNHRSDSDIVQWCNTYIASFPQMGMPNVRIPGKPPLNSSVGRTGTHPAVGIIRTSTVGAGAMAMATLITDLRTNGIIQDYSQCVLLLRSTRNSPNFAGPYIAALQARSIPIYNPRSRDFLDQVEVAQCLGAFVRIIDPQLTNIGNVLSPSIQQLVQAWITHYDTLAAATPALAAYVTQAAQAIANKATGERITPATPTILYRILAHEPFVGYQTNPEMDLRLSKLTRLFESFTSQYGRQLWTDAATPGQLPGWWYGSFYYGLCGYLEKRGLDDDEDEQVLCPAGYFPIMTVHQAKGLEFDFVFAGNLGGGLWSSNAHQLEQDMRPFRVNPPAIVHPIADSQWHDDIRQHFVAYSRAKFALVLIATDSQLRRTGAQTASFGGQGGGWVRQNFARL
jgi:DNA helicase II / ATP-dependent DNA helicase PcrA